jgi:hypothetical protein
MLSKMDSTINREMAVKYRRHLIPLFLFPSFAFTGELVLPKVLMSAIFIPLFLAIGIYGGLPYFTKRASFAYWMLAMAILMAGIVPAILIVVVLTAIRPELHGY